MRIARLERLIEKAERRPPTVEEILERSGCVEIEGVWVNPMDFVPREVRARWAIEFVEALNSGDEVATQRLAEEGAQLLEEGKIRASEELR